MSSTIQIREMRPDEAKALRTMNRRAFGPFESQFFLLKGHILVAERDGELLGATLLTTFKLSGGRKGGNVDWIFTDPEVQGQGAGQALTEAAIAYFEDERCTDLFACVEGYNPSSSKLFATRGFGILSPGTQFRRYGIGTFAMWYHTVHFIDVGFFLWTRPLAEEPDSPAVQWWGTLLLNAVIFCLALWRQQGFRTFNPLLLLFAPLSLLLFFGARSLAMLAAARAQGIRLRYRAWESGFPTSLVIALALGGLFPVPGSYYPCTDRWRYREWVPRLGPVALAGILPTLLISWGLWAVGRFGTLSPELALGRSIAAMAGMILGLLDTVTIVFPLVSFNGRRVWDWKPWVWALVAAATVALYIVA